MESDYCFRYGRSDIALLPQKNPRTFSHLFLQATTTILLLSSLEFPNGEKYIVLIPGRIPRLYLCRASCSAHDARVRSGVPLGYEWPWLGEMRPWQVGRTFRLILPFYSRYFFVFAPRAQLKPQPKIFHKASFEPVTGMCKSKLDGQRIFPDSLLYLASNRWKEGL